MWMDGRFGMPVLVLSAAQPVFRPLLGLWRGGPLPRAADLHERYLVLSTCPRRVGRIR